MAENTVEHIIIAFTGHRDLELSMYYQYRTELVKAINEIISSNDHKYFLLRTGGAIGADQIAIDVCKELEIKYEIIPVKENKHNPYVVQAEKIILDAIYLIAMWDGIFNGKEGGTSDVIAKFIELNGDQNFHVIKVQRL
ncbi:MAG: hypothetical protein HOP11_11940 [Saprospiraceae bacterium]|nr:hypothetical protein [Saprospiraceae bacterium]